MAEICTDTTFALLVCLVLVQLKHKIVLTRVAEGAVVVL